MSACMLEVVDELLREQSAIQSFNSTTVDAAAALFRRRRCELRDQRMLSAGTRQSRASS